MDGDETIPLAALIAFLYRRKRIAACDTGDIQPAFRRDFSVEIFVLAEPERVERPDVLLRFKFAPQHARDVFRGGDPVLEIRHVQVEVLVVELLDNGEQHPLQIEQIDDHAGLGIDLTGHRDFEHIVVPVRGRIVARAEDGAIFRLIPFRPDVAMSSREFDAFG